MATQTNTTPAGTAARWAPGSRLAVIYVKGGAECRSPWFTNWERAARALDILRRRYGAAVLYRD